MVPFCYTVGSAYREEKLGERKGDFKSEIGELAD